MFLLAGVSQWQLYYSLWKSNNSWARGGVLHRHRGIQCSVINWIIAAFHFPPRSIGILIFSLITLEDGYSKQVTPTLGLSQELKRHFSLHPPVHFFTALLHFHCAQLQHNFFFSLEEQSLKVTQNKTFFFPFFLFFPNSDKAKQTYQTLVYVKSEATHPQDFPI